MAIRPNSQVLTGTSVDVLNAIRNTATQNYKDYIPVATPDADVIKGIGSILMELPELRNEFLTNLVNRIAKVIITSKMYDNPWGFFKKGILEYGESVEEIFVNIAKAELYDPATADITVFKRRIPDVRAAFHVRNYEAKYPVTIQDEDIKRAFLTLDGVNNLITKIYESLYVADQYDEFNVMKYMLALHILDGRITPVIIPAPTDEYTIKQDVTVIKATSNKMTFMTDKYNLAGVKTHSTHDEQYIIIDADFEAQMDVNVLAAAFHMDKAEYLAHRVAVDGFGELDLNRLHDLFYDDPTYREISANDLDTLNEIPAVLVDRNFFMLFDNLITTETIRNPDGLYTNVFLHVWKTFSISPFANAVSFVTEEGAATNITVSPDTANAVAGETLHFSANVEGAGIFNKVVNWTVSGNESNNTVMDNSGNLRIGSDETATELEVMARLATDDSVAGSATVSIGSTLSSAYKITVAPDSRYTISAPEEKEAGTDVTITIAHKWDDDGEAYNSILINGNNLFNQTFLLALRSLTTETELKFTMVNNDLEITTI